MAVTVVPTLAAMAEVYAVPATGGPDSPRFERYVAAATAGSPVANYNPMTSKPVGRAIDALLAIDAEMVAATGAEEAAQRLGWTEPLRLHLVVATPGMWTDRQWTTVEATLDRGRATEILWWFDDPPDQRAVAGAAAATATRAIWWAVRDRDGRRSRPRPAPVRTSTEPRAGRRDHEVTLADVAAREGVAGHLAGRVATTSAAAAEALEVLADDPSRSTAVAFLWGDEWATALGHPPLGLGPFEGLDHVVAVAARAGRSSYSDFSIIPTR